jgi:predicted transcriptional regulator
MNSEEHVVAPSASHVFENATKHIDKLKKDLEDLVGAINSIRDSCEYVLRRFVRVKLVIFKMPSEYYHGKVLQEKGTGDIVELRILNKEISSKLRTLRKELNKILHIEGYRVSDLWVLRHNADINRVEIH